MGDYYYNRSGEPISQQEWATLLAQEDYRRVGMDTVDDPGKPGISVMVSTVWLGLDHGWGNYEPIIFETMIFGGDFDQWQDRYATEAEAIAGHAAALAMVQGALTGEHPTAEELDEMDRMAMKAEV